MVTSPGTLLFHVVPVILLLFAVVCLVLGIREKKWFNMGMTFLVAAGITGYVIPSILHNMGVPTTTKIPTANYTSRTLITFIPAEPSSWINTNPGHVVTVRFLGCGHGTVTIIGPGIYETVSIPDTISLRFNNTGTYYISYFCEVGKSTMIVKVAYAAVEVHKISINWLVEALIDSLNMIIQSTFSTICNMFGRLLQFFGLNYLYLMLGFNFVNTCKTVLIACISISLILVFM